MKTMCKNDCPEMKIEVSHHYILSNGWEYYETPERYDEKEIRFGLVMGLETELGYFSIDEIKPYVRSSKKLTKNDDLMPAEGWHWLE